MTPVHQTMFHDVVSVGNCFSACVASLLDLPLSEVPHFCNDYHPDIKVKWPMNFHVWLSDRGLVSIEFTRETLKQAHSDFWGHHLICGQSPRGQFLHSIVGHNGCPYFDPHPSKAMLLPESVRYWQFMFIFERRKLGD